MERNSINPQRFQVNLLKTSRGGRGKTLVISKFHSGLGAFSHWAPGEKKSGTGINEIELEGSIRRNREIVSRIRESENHMIYSN